MQIQKNISLSQYTTYQIGGVAEFFAIIKTENDLAEVFDWAEKNKQEFRFIGGGSNILINMDFIKGLVIKVENADIRFFKMQNEVILICGAGQRISSLAEIAQKESCSGFEWAIDLPGTVGGAIRGNAGAYGSYIGDNLKEVKIYQDCEKRFKFLLKEDCNFKYKDSIFKHHPQALIWEAIFVLKIDNSIEIKKRMNEYQQKRSASQPKEPSAGCVFKNLILEDVLKINPELAHQAQELGIAKNGKISAGWIISQLGLKGEKFGQAQISQQHANFIVNTNQAKADDVLNLINLIKQKAKEKFNLELEEEIEILS